LFVVPPGDGLEWQLSGRNQAPFSAPLQLTFRLNEIVLATYELAPGPFSFCLPCPPLPAYSTAEVLLEADQSWQPLEGHDERHLACLLDVLRLVDKNAIGFFGDYPTWESALADSDGYGAPVILERTRASLLQIKNGAAVHERDSVLFPTVQHNFALLAGLLQAVTNQELSVLDFGGSLGSLYYQCRSFLSHLKSLRWSIVEQPAYVNCGRQEFADEQLRFYSSIEECLRHESPQVLLLSGVVQCLSDPYAFLGSVLRHGIPHVIVDRTAFLTRDADRLTVERVPAWIYPASYPSWFLSESRFLGQFRPYYHLLADFPALDTNQPEGESAYYKGFLFKALPPASSPDPPVRDFCTYFDEAYLDRGLALYSSLARQYPAFTLSILCLDEATWNYLHSLALPHARLHTVADLEAATPGLATARYTRSRLEFYFTCTPALPFYLLVRNPSVEQITYLDADLYFHSSPEPLFDELADRSIGIIRHKCERWREERYGIYNVGWLTLRNDDRGRACLRWWLERCLEWCFSRVEDGKFADQKYLDEFPHRFANVAVLEHRGANVAVWNIESETLSIRDGQVYVCNVPLLFFHFHGLKQVDYWHYETGLENYHRQLHSDLLRYIYTPYVRQLLRFAQRRWSEAAIRRRLQDISARLCTLETKALQVGSDLTALLEEQKTAVLLRQQLAILTEDEEQTTARIRFVSTSAADVAAAERLEALQYLNQLLASKQATAEQFRRLATQLISELTVASQNLRSTKHAAAESLIAIEQVKHLLAQEQGKMDELRRNIVVLEQDLARVQAEQKTAITEAANRLAEFTTANESLATVQAGIQQLRESSAQLAGDIAAANLRRAEAEPAAVERPTALEQNHPLL